MIVEAKPLTEVRHRGSLVVRGADYSTHCTAANTLRVCSDHYMTGSVRSSKMRPVCSEIRRLPTCSTPVTLTLARMCSRRICTCMCTRRNAEQQQTLCLAGMNRYCWRSVHGAVLLRDLHLHRVPQTRPLQLRHLGCHGRAEKLRAALLRDHLPATHDAISHDGRSANGSI